ncbi:hypothetical protein [Streptomyces sp. NPDC056169]|uniref:hypothetical protein n=1 Tax=Streptomyces sp. NPDC056169 TaxID=3345734 RepID=UPI0035DDDCFA
MTQPNSRRPEITPRERLAIMIRTSRGDMTVWDAPEVQDALDAYRAAVLREAAALVRAGAEDGDFNAPEYGSHENVLEAADMLDRTAEEARS